MLAGGPAGGAHPRQRQVGDVDLEAALAPYSLDGRDDHRIVGRQLPRAGADAAVQVGVLSGGQDVELFATVRAVAVADDPELLEDVEGSIDGRRDGVRVARTTPVDELGTGDMA